MPHLTEWRFPRLFSRLFDPEDFFDEKWPSFFHQPEIDLYEEGNDLILKANLPGIDPREVEVYVTRDRIQLKGEFARSEERNEEGYYHSERSFGKFNRTIPLPVNVRHREARAKSNHGVLEIRVPKEDGVDGEFTRLNIEAKEDGKTGQPGNNYNLS